MGNNIPPSGVDAGSLSDRTFLVKVDSCLLRRKTRMRIARRFISCHLASRFIRVKLEHQFLHIVWEFLGNVVEFPQFAANYFTCQPLRDRRLIARCLQSMQLIVWRHLDHSETDLALNGK
jgi:hypothetical protein